jgi:surfactin synthase thioesterase subunit
VHDDTVSRQHLDDWQATTTGTCHRHDFEAGHRVSVEEFDTVLSATASVLGVTSLEPVLHQPFRMPA